MLDNDAMSFDEHVIRGSLTLKSSSFSGLEE